VAALWQLKKDVEDLNSMMIMLTQEIVLGILWNSPKNRYVASLFMVRGSLVTLELPGIFVFRQFFEHYYGFYCWFIGELMVSIHVSELHYYLRASSSLSRIILKFHVHQEASSPIFFYIKYYS